MVNTNVSRNEYLSLIMNRVITFLGITNAELEHLKGVTYEHNICAHFDHQINPVMGCISRAVHLYYNTDDPTKPVLMVDVTSEAGRVSPAPYTTIALVARLLWASTLNPAIPDWWKPLKREMQSLAQDLAP